MSPSLSEILKLHIIKSAKTFNFYKHLLNKRRNANVTNLKIYLPSLLDKTRSEDKHLTVLGLSTEIISQLSKILT